MGISAVQLARPVCIRLRPQPSPREPTPRLSSRNSLHNRRKANSAAQPAAGMLRARSTTTAARWTYTSGNTSSAGSICQPPGVPHQMKLRSLGTSERKVTLSRSTAGHSGCAAVRCRVGRVVRGDLPAVVGESVVWRGRGVLVVAVTFRAFWRRIFSAMWRAVGCLFGGCGTPWAY